jgi:broad specificity phosphatase PhoE
MLAAALLAALPSAAAAQVIFLVRHAERAAAATPAAPQPAKGGHGMMMPADPPLTPAGQQRAARLASMLAASGITQIFTSEYKRTRQTAAPLAEKLKLTPVMAAARDPEPLVERLRRVQGAALVVGHADTIPDLLRRLGVTETVTIGDNDYGNLFVVVPDGTARKPTLIRLHY